AVEVRVSEAEAGTGGVLDCELAALEEPDVNVAVGRDRRVGEGDEAEAGGDTARVRRVPPLLDHRNQEAGPRLLLQLDLPGLAAVPGDGEEDVAAAGGRGLAGELARRVEPSPDLVQVAVIGVRPAVGQVAEGVDGQIGVEFKGDR